MEKVNKFFIDQNSIKKQKLDYSPFDLFYWFDAYEYKGNISLFGKAATLTLSNEINYVTACLIVEDVTRFLYVLPRIGFSIEQVSFELNQLIEKIINLRIVKRMYPFDSKKNIPYETSYLEIECLGNQFISPNLKGNTFEHIFNSQSTCLEQFILRKKIKGPCWLQITSTFIPESISSWCKLEFSTKENQISKYNNMFLPKNQTIKIDSTPPLNLLCLLIRTQLNDRTNESEIFCACGLVMNNYFLDKSAQLTYNKYFLAVKSNQTYPATTNFIIEQCESERVLLSYLISKIQLLDTDIILGHDLFNFNLDYVLNRCNKYKIPYWSRLGRLKRSAIIKDPSCKEAIINICTGRLLCDVMQSAKDLLIKSKNYDLYDLSDSEVLTRPFLDSLFYETIS